MLRSDPVYSALGKPVGRPAASPTSVLHEDAACLMANWTWESAAASSSQQASPLRSSNSHSTDPAMHQQEQRQEPQQLASMPEGSGSAAATSECASSRSLVETLQTCLTALPPAPAAAAAAAGMPPSRSGGSSPLGTKKPPKRRSRASRRTPTQVLEADPSAFRDMVQRLTGLPTAAAPTRPQPQRVSPGGMRASAPPALGPNYPLLNSLLRAGPLIDHSSSHIAFLQRLQQSAPGCELPAPPFTNPFTHPFYNPIAVANPFLPNDMAGLPVPNPLFANPIIKREDEGSGSRTMPQPIQGPTSLQPWLQATATAPIPPFSIPRHDQQGFGTEIDAAFSAGPSDARSIPSEGMFAPAPITSGGLASQEDQEFSISQIDEWFMSNHDQMR